MNRKQIATLTMALGIVTLGCAVEPARGVTLTGADRQALEEVGVADAQQDGDLVRLLDADGVDLGWVAMDPDGTLRAEIDGAALVQGPDGLDVQCDGQQVIGSLAEDAASTLAPCAAALTATAVLFGSEAPVADVAASQQALLADSVCGIACTTEAVTTHVVGSTVWVEHHCAQGYSITHSIGNDFCH